MPRDEVLLADILLYARQAARAAAGLTAADLDADPDRQSMVLWPLSSSARQPPTFQTLTDKRIPTFRGAEWSA